MNGYKLIEKKQNINVLNFNKIESSDNYFFGYGNVTGGVLGKLYQFKTGDNEISDSSSDSFIVILPLKRFHAEMMLNNYKKEPFRFKKLASEIRKEEVISEFETKFRLHKLQDMNYENSEISTLGNSNTNEKRLSLNNGIFKSNDNYAA